MFRVQEPSIRTSATAPKLFRLSCARAAATLPGRHLRHACSSGCAVAAITSRDHQHSNSSSAGGGSMRCWRPCWSASQRCSIAALSRRHALLVALLVSVAALSLGGSAHAAAPDPTWPDPASSMVLRIAKISGFENETESQWMHLHTDGDPSSWSLGLTIQVLRAGDGYSAGEGLTASGIQVRYTVMGVPVSGWLAPGAWDLRLNATSAALRFHKDGVLDISLEVSGPARQMYRPWPAFLHLKRNRPLSSLVPVMLGDTPTMAGVWVPGVTRIDRRERRAANPGFPANPALSPWSTPPYETDLYVEQLTPGGSLFEEMQMWWEDLPSHPGLFFIRGLQPYQGEDPRGLDHTRLPVADGPRGVGWMSSYVQGRVDREGRFAFAELAGRVGWLLPDGEIVTLAGWVTRPGLSPVWVRKSLSVVRGSQELRGGGELFTARQGFGRPMDVAFDPEQPSVLYVPDLTAHCVWRVEVLRDNRPAPDVEVTLLAGSESGEEGFVDGIGAAARFREPFSVAFSHDSSGEPVLYVSDSANHAIRRIALQTGAVTTLVGGPGVLERISAAGVDPYDRPALRAGLRNRVSLAEAAAGARPDIYWPSAIRADSRGSIILLEHGFGQIRRLDAAGRTAEVLADVDQKFSEYDHGWAWLDVDDIGATGPQDGVWWCKAVGDTVQGDDSRNAFNEVVAWMPPGGGGSRFVFTGRGGGANPVGFGARDGHTPPHYPWLVAVDPRGGVLMAGMGVHGVSRLRRLERGDPTATESYDFWLGQQVYSAPGSGLEAASLAFRFGNGAHNMLGLGLDGWATRGLSPEQLLDFYGVPRSLRNDMERTQQLLAYVSSLSGPARDALPAAAADTQPPSPPSQLGVAIWPLDAASMLLKWGVLSRDDAAVAGYQLQLVRGPLPRFDEPSSAVTGYYGVMLGNTEMVLLEGLQRGVRYHARLRAADLGGRWSNWSVPRAFRLPT